MSIYPITLLIYILPVIILWEYKITVVCTCNYIINDGHGQPPVVNCNQLFRYLVSSTCFVVIFHTPPLTTTTTTKIVFRLACDCQLTSILTVIEVINL